MNLAKIYNEVKCHIETVDFSALWDGFAPLKFALYNNKECFFDGNYIEKTDAFLANTAIFYNGEWIAIWCVQEGEDTVILASKIVHEMFHGFQMANNDSRFFDDMDALYNYKYTDGNLSLKLRENRLLCHLAEHFDKTLFAEFLGIRKYRLKMYSYEYHYEAYIEQIEGTANYVELQCLKQLSAEQFEKKLLAMREHIVNQRHLLSVRIVSYDIGALLLFVLAENAVAFEKGFSSVPFSEAILEGIEESPYASDFSMKELIDAHYSKAAAVVHDAIHKNTLVCDAPSDLLGVNIYDAVFYQNYIISRYLLYTALRRLQKSNTEISSSKQMHSGSCRKSTGLPDRQNSCWNRVCLYPIGVRPFKFQFTVVLNKEPLLRNS